MYVRRKYDPGYYSLYLVAQRKLSRLNLDSIDFETEEKKQIFEGLLIGRILARKWRRIGECDRVSIGNAAVTLSREIEKYILEYRTDFDSDPRAKELGCIFGEQFKLPNTGTVTVGNVCPEHKILRDKPFVRRR